MNLVVNKLPSITWNHLKMNETRVDLEENLEGYQPKADYNPAEISWNGSSGFAPVLHGDLDAVTAGVPAGLAETKENAKMETPLVLSYDYDKKQKAASRLVLHAKEGSLLKVVVVLSGDPEISVLQAEILADKNAEIQVFLIDLLGEKSLCMNHLAGLAQDGAKIQVIRLDLGGEKIYSGMNMDLKGFESSFCSETGYHVKPGQVLDMNYVAVHEGKNTEATMEVNGTLEEGAKKIFRGTIDFRQGCAGTKAAENENVMLMGDEMVNQTIPVILCKEEDVEGSHGASIGQLDDKVLFYLGSRGISKEAAQAMIAQARIDAICEKIPVEAVRSQIREFEEVRGISHGEEF